MFNERFIVKASHHFFFRDLAWPKITHSDMHTAIYYYACLLYDQTIFIDTACL